MKKTIAMFTILLAASLSSSAFAKDNADVTEYGFDDELVEGDLLVPSNGAIVVRQKDTNPSLIKVRGHFIPEMLKSVERI